MIKFHSKFSHIYLEKQVEKLPLTKLIISKFSRANIIKIDHYKDILDSKNYDYSTHIAPFDIKVRELGNMGKSRLESAMELGIAFEVAPKLSIEDGIEATRKALTNCWFDKEKCKLGIEYLKAYQKRWDDKNQCFKNKPMHNFASHCADSFRTGIIGQGAEISDWKQEVPINTNYIV